MSHFARKQLESIGLWGREDSNLRIHDRLYPCGLEGNLLYPTCDAIRAIDHDQWVSWLLDSDREQFNIGWFFTPDEVEELLSGHVRVDLVHRWMVFDVHVEGAEAKVKRQRLKKKARGWIYFVQARDEDPIKIGFASEPNKRLRELQTGSAYPLRLLATIPGRTIEERELHKRFAGLRLHGEWFRPDPSLLDYIARAHGA